MGGYKVSVSELIVQLPLKPLKRTRLGKEKKIESGKLEPLRSDQPNVHRIENNLRGRLDPQFLHDVLAVGVHRVLA